MKSSSAHLVLVSIMCVVSLVGYGIWYGIIANKSVAVTALQNQIDTKTETVARMTTTRTASAEIVNDERVVQSYFVPETGVVAFIDDLEVRGRAIGATVDILSVSTDDGRASTDGARHDSAESRPALAFSLSIKGTFDAVMRTVGAIEYAPYAISISILSVGQEDKNSWHANLTLLVGSIPI